MFTIEMLPANYGDAIWIEYGNPESPNVVLVDCGFKTAYREVIKRIEERDLSLELFILTHVDEDHIKGAISLLQDNRLGSHKIRDIWFNGYDQMLTAAGRSDALGAMQGEFFSAIIKDREYSWNEDWKDKQGKGGAPVVVGDSEKLPTITLPGGMNLTLLSPTPKILGDMAKRWKEEIEKKQIEPGDVDKIFQVLQGRGKAYQSDKLGGSDLNPDRLGKKKFKEDSEEPNGSSIAVLAEYNNKKALLTGDAFPSVLCESIKSYLEAEGESRLKIDLLKVSHHGSAGNTNNELLSLVKCSEFMISTNGAKFNHPSPECVSRIVTAYKEKVTVRFSSAHEESKIWRNKKLQEKFNYVALYPKDESVKMEL